MYYIVIYDLDESKKEIFLNKIGNRYLNNTDTFEIVNLDTDKELDKFIRENSIYEQEEDFTFIGQIDDEIRKNLFSKIYKKRFLPYSLNLFDDGILKLSIESYGDEISMYGFDKDTVIKQMDELEELKIKAEIYTDEIKEESPIKNIFDIN